MCSFEPSVLGLSQYEEVAGEGRGHEVKRSFYAACWPIFPAKRFLEIQLVTHDALGLAPLALSCEHHHLLFASAQEGEIALFFICLELLT